MRKKPYNPTDEERKQLRDEVTRLYTEQKMTILGIVKLMRERPADKHPSEELVRTLLTEAAALRPRKKSYHPTGEERKQLRDEVTKLYTEQKMTILDITVKLMHERPADKHPSERLVHTLLNEATTLRPRGGSRKKA